MIVRIDIEGARHELQYASIRELTLDAGLKALFDARLVTACSVHSGDKRITAIPIMEWGRLVDGVISNSVAILRGMVDGKNETAPRALPRYS